MGFLKKEVILYLGLLVILAAIQHSDLLTHPSDRINRLLNDGTQSLLHPLVWVTPVYMIVLMFRLVFRWIKNFLTRKKTH